MITIFVLTMIAVMFCMVADTETLEMTALRNTYDYEKAEYLAAAGINHAFSYLDADTTWRTGISSTEFPTGSGNTYAATAATGTGTQVIVTGTGTVGSVTRTLTVTIETSN